MTTPNIPPLNQSKWQEIALGYGFPLAGISPPTLSEKSKESFSAWVENGYAANMNWLTNRKKEKLNPDLYFKGATAVLVLGLPYNPQPSGDQIHLASYSNGEDYHDTIKKKLWEIIRELTKQFGSNFEFRPCVDTSPVLEREFAKQANIGWQGKNTMLINQKLGSYFFIAEIFTNLPVESNVYIHPDRCGTCTACLDACPTKAFEAPYILNSSKCISYQTIENKAELDENLDYQNWIYGCDICNSVCPWNVSKINGPKINEPKKNTQEVLFLDQPTWGNITLPEILSLTDEQFSKIFKKTPIKRIKRFGLIRNALTIWLQSPKLAPFALIEKLASDTDLKIQKLAKDSILKYNTTNN